MIEADSIKIEAEEDGFHLLLTDGSGLTYKFNIHGVAVDLLKEVNRTIRPYWAEGEQVYREFMRHVTSDDGYALDDPKHPTYHERMSGIWDDREKV